MTEARWLTSHSVDDMLRDLREHCAISRVRGKRRCFRLFACACCRRLWDLFANQYRGQVVEVSERAADGQAGGIELAEAYQTARVLAAAARTEVDAAQARGDPNGFAPGLLVQGFYGTRAAEWTASPRGGPRAASLAAYNLCVVATLRGAPRHFEELCQAHTAENREQAALLRDIFGNPFQPVAFSPEWLAGRGRPVAALARAIYEERRFNDLPILADALEEAGCPSAALVEHCRGLGPHTRGCWALDLLLGKP